VLIPRSPTAPALGCQVDQGLQVGVDDATVSVSRIAFCKKFFLDPLKFRNHRPIPLQ
jgi:hypothetical protein